MHDHQAQARGGPEAPVTVDLHDLSAESSEIKCALDEASHGNYVLLSPPASAGKTSRIPTHANSWNAGDVLTMLSGGTALGLVALALAPASVPVIAAATVAGLVLGRLAKKLDPPKGDAPMM